MASGISLIIVWARNVVAQSFFSWENIIICMTCRCIEYCTIQRQYQFGAMILTPPKRCISAIPMPEASLREKIVCWLRQLKILETGYQVKHFDTHSDNFSFLLNNFRVQYFPLSCCNTSLKILNISKPLWSTKQGQRHLLAKHLTISIISTACALVCIVDIIPKHM